VNLTEQLGDIFCAQFLSLALLDSGQVQGLYSQDQDLQPGELQGLSHCLNATTMLVGVLVYCRPSLVSLASVFGAFRRQMNIVMAVLLSSAALSHSSIGRTHPHCGASIIFFAVHRANTPVW